MRRKHSLLEEIIKLPRLVEDLAVYNQFGPAVYPMAKTVRVEYIRG